MIKTTLGKVVLITLLIVFVLISIIVLHSIYFGLAIMGDAYMVADYHKKEVVSFYLKHNYCPIKNQDTTIKFAESVHLESGEKGTCYVRVKMRKNTPVFGDKTLTLMLQFDKTSNSYKIVCSTDTFSIYLPSACK